jgi:oxygen-independent coproporphyrinogen-3 oxidase
MTGLYIHLPFCKKKCPYCSFCSIECSNKEAIDAYINAVITELKSEIKEQEVDTIYIGGGTPSIIPFNLFEYLLIHLQSRINFSNIREFTVEVNPESTTEDLIKLFRNYRVSRISMGVQSFDDEVLYFLGRIHSSHMVYNAIDNIMKYYNLDNISIDLMYDIPFVNSKKIFTSIKEAINLQLTHISAYNFTFENNYLKPFFDNFNEQMSYVINCFENYGYEQYEISNFCKHNNVSRHNIKYWLIEEYLGIGASSHSMFKKPLGRLRRENVKDVSSYIYNPFAARIIYNIDLNESLKEDIIFGLRCLRGIDIEKYSDIPSFEKIYYEINKLIDENLIYKKNNIICLTKKGILLYDLVALRLWGC